jgi:ABC-2 type transport system permease protein
MNALAIRTIVRKEWAELYKNTLVLLTVALLPLFFAVLPLAILWSTNSMADSSALGPGTVPSQMKPLCGDLSGGACTQVMIASQFMILFMMIPLIIPATIVPYSIVGEKTQRTLEPLLATPVSTSDLLLAKNLATIIPALLATWLAFAVYTIGVRLIVTDPGVLARLFEARWFLAVFVVGPFLALFANAISIMVSARANDPRVAQQITSLVIFPVLLIFLGQIAGWIYFSSTFVLVMAVVVAVLDVILSLLAVRVFDREAILTRWS